MAGLLPHQVQWVTASPLWGASSTDPARMQAPELLRFESERFMEELAARLQALPKPDLSALVAHYESFRERAPREPADPPNQTLKLYQPAHGRFYLVAASLVCRLAGLPDHVIDAAKSERAGFVLRRLRADGGEDAWVPDPQDPTKQRHLWKALSASEREGLTSDEELFPLFPVNFTVDGRRRRILVGFVPTSSRETFVSAEAFAPAGAEVDPLVDEAESRVVGPYEFLQGIPSDAEESDVEKDTSRFLLLDLADFLQSRLQDLWTAVGSGIPPPASSLTRALYDSLNTRRVEGGTSATWRQALAEAWEDAPNIGAGKPSTVNYNLRHSDLPVSELRTGLTSAVKASTYQPPPPSGEVPKLEAGETQYALRCVYQRPGCGPLQPPVISKRTPPFTLAPFFDPDAPARPIRITLPVDTSLAGLRRFKKNVGFVLSDKLRKQMSRATDLKGVMDKKIPEGTSFELGEICSFSIPIITLCAFMILMILLILLNIIFWWLPFLKICLPTVKAK